MTCSKLAASLLAVSHLLGVQSSGRNDELQSRPPAQQVLQQAEQHISVDRSLVGLVQHQGGVAVQIVIGQILPHEHAVRHVLDDGLRGGHVVEANAVADLLAQSAAVLRRAKRVA